MEFTVATEDLKSKLEIARRFTGKSSMEVTKSIKLYIPEKHNTLIIEASDFNKGCRIKIDNVNIIERGIAVVDGDRLQKIVSSFKHTELHFKRSDQLIIRSQEGALFKLSILNPLEFPSIPPHPDTSKKFIINVNTLLDICEKLGFATDPSLTKEGTTRLFAELVYFREQIAFATDSFKLAAIIMPTFSIDGMDLPITSLPFLRLLSGEVTITPYEGQTYLQEGDFFFFLKAPVTRAPDIGKLIRSFNKPHVTYVFSKESLDELRTSLKRLVIISDNITALFKKDKIVMGAFSQTGEHVCTVEILAKEFNQEVAMAYDAQFLLNAIRYLEGPTISVFGEKSPVKITEGNFTCLIQATVQSYIPRLKQYDEGGI